MGVLPNLGTDPALASFAVVASPTPSSVNEMVLLTATLTGVSPNAAPSGTVTFNSDGSALSDCTDVNITQGVSPSLVSTATCTTQTLTAGSPTDSLTVVYSGDTIYDTGVGETSPAVTQTVAPLSPTLTLTTSSSSTQVNQSVTFTATLGGVSFTPITPTGTVNFTVGTAPATTIGTCGTQGLTQLAGVWSATCTTASLALRANQTIGAVYTGDTNFKTATAPTISQTITQATPTLALTTSSGSTQVNQSVTFTATLGGAGVSFAPTTPGGTVNFTVGTAPATTIGTCGTQGLTQLAGVWSATCTTSSLAVGANQTIGAVYSGDANFKTATAASISQSVVPFAATINVGTTPTAVNQQVTIMAQLAGTGIAFTPTSPSGKFTFTATVGGTPTPICSGVSVSATGGASCQWTPPEGTAATTYPISVSYAGDSNFTVAAAGTATQTFIPFAATINVTGPGTTPVVNTAVTLTAQLAGTGIAFTPTAPDGKFTFSATINGTAKTLCSGVLVSATGGASCQTSALVAQSDAISVTYGSDSNFTTAAAGTLTQNVSAFAATINVTGPGTTPVVNTAVTLTAQLAGSGIAFTPTAPAGKFTFSATINGTATTLCTGVLVSATGGATCQTSALAAPSDAISVTYGSDTNFTTAAAGTLTQNVSGFAATINVTGPGTTTVNTPVTLTGQLAGTGIAFTPTAPAGKFTFSATIQRDRYHLVQRCAGERHGRSKLPDFSAGGSIRCHFRYLWQRHELHNSRCGYVDPERIQGYLDVDRVDDDSFRGRRRGGDLYGTGGTCRVNRAGRAHRNGKFPD